MCFLPVQSFSFWCTDVDRVCFVDALRWHYPLQHLAWCHETKGRGHAGRARGGLQKCEHPVVH